MKVEKVPVESYKVVIELEPEQARILAKVLRSPEDLDLDIHGSFLEDLIIFIEKIT